MSRMIAGFSSMLLLSLCGSIVSHADLVGAVSLSFSGSAQLRGREIPATFGTLTPPMEKVGDYILVPDTDVENDGGFARRGRKRGAPTDEDATFTVDAASSTTVELEFEVLMPTIFTDSFYVWFDDNKSDNIEWQPGQFTSFTWAVVGRFTLSAGAHILHVGVREEGAKLRTLRIKTGDVVFTNMPACPAGFFSDVTQICQDANCATPIVNAVGVCSAGCKTGFFSSGLPGQTCQDANCAIPANADATTGFCVCDSGGCSSGFFSSAGQLCQDANCAIPTSADPVTGVCLSGGCASPGFFGSSGKCHACGDSNCDTCAARFGSDICTECSSGFILDNSSDCVERCPSGQYGVVDEDDKCTDCGDSKCDVCAGNICTDCSSGFILSPPGCECVPQCPDGYSAVGRVCLCTYGHMQGKCDPFDTC